MVLYFTKHFHTCPHLCSIFYHAYVWALPAGKCLLPDSDCPGSQPSRYRKFQDCRQITQRSCELNFPISKMEIQYNLPDCDGVNERNYTSLGTVPNNTAFMVSLLIFSGYCIQMYRNFKNGWAISILWMLIIHWGKQTNKKIYNALLATMEV